MLSCCCAGSLPSTVFWWLGSMVRLLGVIFSLVLFSK